MPYAETVEECKASAYPLTDDELQGMHAYWRAAGTFGSGDQGV